ncbi:hypothetical protein N1032_22890 [Herbiconiux sp. CPCC 203386]|uniref:Uncharacterized protein n=1 Tax=Herbiconiux daphne TaxID=2970914 RepID=A0ABT2H9E9_9MICO|nr:hypothetical protein [Herbiconiux daphne]
MSRGPNLKVSLKPTPAIQDSGFLVLGLKESIFFTTFVFSEPNFSLANSCFSTSATSFSAFLESPDAKTFSPGDVLSHSIASLLALSIFSSTLFTD